jgi:hypothetical protein
VGPLTVDLRASTLSSFHVRLDFHSKLHLERGPQEKPANSGGLLVVGGRETDSRHRLHQVQLLPGHQVKGDYALRFLLRLQLAFDLVRDLGRRGRPELLHLTELLTVLMNSGA